MLKTDTEVGPIRAGMLIVLHVWGMVKSAIGVIIGNDNNSDHEITCLLLRPGDAVLVDDPCYFNFQALLRAHQVRIVGVPFTISGPDISTFEQVLIDEKPRLYITNSALHNPTGASISPQTAHRILNLATAHDLTIVEMTSLRTSNRRRQPRLAILESLDRALRC